MKGLCKVIFGKSFEVYKYIIKDSENRKMKDYKLLNNRSSEIVFEKNKSILDFLNNNDNIKVRIEFQSLKEGVDYNNIMNDTSMLTSSSNFHFII